MIGLASRRRLGAVAALAALLAGGQAFAQGHGGGGGGHFGGGGHSFGGGGHFSGGAHFGGARVGGAPHLGGGAGHFASPGFAGHYSSGAHIGYAPRPSFSSHGYVASHGSAYHGGYTVRPGYAPRAGYVRPGGGYVRPGGGYVRPGGGYVRPGGGYVRPGGGYVRPGGGYVRPGYYGRGYGHYWAGGYWGGGYWPRAYYGWGFPLFLAALPVAYATYYWGGIPYYYCNDVYYVWNPDQNGYVVTDPPPVAGTAVDDSTAVAAGEDQGASGQAGAEVYAYPQNGQTEEQQSNDKYECHTWARSQTGFDPTVSNSSGSPDDYRRAMVACLSARGYSAE